MRVGQTAAGTIYLAHPSAREITLGCSGKNFSNQLFAKADRKPTAAYLNLIASAAAIIFTLPKDDMLKGATRCVQADGPDPRRRCLDPLPPSRHALHPHQDRILDHDLPQPGTNRGAGPVHHAPGSAPIACILTIGFTKLRLASAPSEVKKQGSCT